jgi:xanthine dehydrogenase accessory factor
MSNRFLIEAFGQWRQADATMVLATVIATAGSTYSKPGRHILINADGQHAGLLSGGCLEGDLAERANSVLATGIPQTVTYDMRDDADDLWGIGLGCNGMMEVLLQRLNASNDWQPFTALAEAMAAGTPATAALVTACDAPAAHTGDCYLRTDGTDRWTGSNSSGIRLTEPATLPARVTATSDTNVSSILYWRIRPWPRLLLLGAGPDAVPVAKLARALGWQVTLADHRPHYIEQVPRDAADDVRLIEAARLGEHLQLDRYSAVVVMSHHLETDRTYLLALADVTHDYVGILGPAGRKQKLLTELQLADSDFGKRLHGPVGLPIGADSPETIALALLGEIQSLLPGT